ncbi:hypothetical protein, partial [Streptomyces katrae]
GAPSPAAAAAKQQPAPHEHTFANELAAPKENPQQRDSAPVAPAVAGCDRHYGSVNVCVPAAFPAEVKKTCLLYTS